MSVISFVVILGIAWTVLYVFGITRDTVSPYWWTGGWYTFAVLIYPPCEYGWYEFVRPRQLWVWPLGTVLAFPVAAAITFFKLSNPEHAAEITWNCLILPFLPYLLISKWPFFRFITRRLQGWVRTQGDKRGG